MRLMATFTLTQVKNNKDTLVPNAAGSFTELTPSAGNNYACVDTIGSDYVYNNTVKSGYALINSYNHYDTKSCGTDFIVSAVVANGLNSYTFNGTAFSLVDNLDIDETSGYIRKLDVMKDKSTTTYHIAYAHGDDVFGVIDCDATGTLSEVTNAVTGGLISFDDWHDVDWFYCNSTYYILGVAYFWGIASFDGTTLSSVTNETTAWVAYSCESQVTNVADTYAYCYYGAGDRLAAFVFNGTNLVHQGSDTNTGAVYDMWCDDDYSSCTYIFSACENGIYVHEFDGTTLAEVSSVTDKTDAYGITQGCSGKFFVLFRDGTIRRYTHDGSGNLSYDTIFVQNSSDTLSGRGGKIDSFTSSYIISAYNTNGLYSNPCDLDPKYKDSYNVQNLNTSGMTDVTINSMYVEADVKIDGNLGDGVVVQLNCNLEDSGVNLPLTNNYGTFQYFNNTDPSTGNSWTESTINSMEIGLGIINVAITNKDSEILRPNALGDDDDGTEIGDGNTYLCVDDATPDNYNTYVQLSSIYGDDQLWNFENISSATGTIVSVTVTLVEKKCGTGSSSARHLIKVNGTKYTSALNHSPDDTAWNSYSATWTENPNTSTAWTISDINSIQAGVRRTGGCFDVTQCFITVKYETASTINEIRCRRCVAVVDYTGTTNCYLNKPQEISLDHDRNVKMINFWNGSREVYDLNRSGESVMLTGMEFVTSSCTDPSARINCVRTMAKNNEKITISDIGMDIFNKDYYIRSFGWDLISKSPLVYRWQLELEAEDLL